MTFATGFPRRVGSCFSSRSSERSKLRAVPSSRSTSWRSRSPIEIRCRRGGSLGGSRSSRMTRISAIGGFLLGGGDQQDLIDLVDLDQLHLDALVAMGREILADVVGADRQLAVAAVGEDSQLDARGTAVVEQRFDGGADGAARVEDVVDEHAGHSVEPEVELRVADDPLRVLRRLAAADVNVVAVERDVELADRDLATGEVGDPPAQALGERNAARVDADESDLVQLGVAFDDLVRDPGERPVDGLSVEQDLLALRMRHAHAGSGRTRAGRVIHTPFRPHGTGLKGFVVWRDHTAWNGRHPGVVPQPALEPGLDGPGGEAAAAAMTASHATPWNGRHPGVAPPSILRPVEQRALERLADLAVDFTANVQSGPS